MKKKTEINIIHNTSCIFKVFLAVDVPIRYHPLVFAFFLFSLR